MASVPEHFMPLTHLYKTRIDSELILDVVVYIKAGKSIQLSAGDPKTTVNTTHLRFATIDDQNEADDYYFHKQYTLEWNGAQHWIDTLVKGDDGKAHFVVNSSDRAEPLD